MGIISLEGIEFFAFHGFYEEERRIGNRFTIDVHIEADVTGAGVSDSLADTVDYERVYSLIAEVMKGSSSLLENIAANIIRTVREAYPAVKEITVKVAKLNPPIGGICKTASVTVRG